MLNSAARERERERERMGSIAGNYGACIFVAVLLILSNMPCEAQLYSSFYDKTCPKALSTIRKVTRKKVSRERRMAASLIRLHFHDCFVQVFIPFSRATLFVLVRFLF